MSEKVPLVAYRHGVREVIGEAEVSKETGVANITLNEKATEDFELHVDLDSFSMEPLDEREKTPGVEEDVDQQLSLYDQGFGLSEAFKAGTFTGEHKHAAQEDVETIERQFKEYKRLIASSTYGESLKSIAAEHIEHPDNCICCGTDKINPLD